MPKIAKTIFISDLHLSQNQPELITLFIKFITNLINQNNIDSHIDSLYILGDFFNYWIGNDNQEPWHQEIIQLFNRLAKTTKIYFLAGNRDFLVNKKTANLFNFELITTDIKNISVYDKKLTILHGDTLCTNDIKYIKFRKIARDPIIKFLYLAMPIKLRRKLAINLKKQSTQNNKNYNNDSKIFDVSEITVSNVFSEYDSNLMIHGHTHRPKVHTYSNNSHRYVLGDRHSDGAYYLEISKNDNLDTRVQINLMRT